MHVLMQTQIAPLGVCQAELSFLRVIHAERYFLRPLPPGRCESAEPAAVFEFEPVRPSLSTFEAELAARLLVTLPEPDPFEAITLFLSPKG